MNSKPFSDFLGEVEKRIERGKTYAKLFLYNKIESDTEIQKALSYVLNETYQSRQSTKSRVSKKIEVPHSLKLLSEFFESDIEFDSYKQSCKKPALNAPIIIKTKSNGFAIYKQETESACDESYLRKKLKLSAEVSQILLNEKEIRLAILRSLANSEQINPKRLEDHKENIGKLKKVYEQFSKLGKSKSSRFLRSFAEVLKIIKGEEQEVGSWEYVEKVLNTLISQKQETEESSICMKCLENMEPVCTLGCSHQFCTVCIKKYLKGISKQLLPKCLLPTCYHLLSSEELAKFPEYKFPKCSEKNIFCAFCGSSYELVQYDKLHSMCEKCLKGYVEHYTEGQIFEAYKGGNVKMKVIKCPFEESEMDEEKVLELFTGEEKELLHSHAIGLYALK